MVILKITQVPITLIFDITKGMSKLRTPSQKYSGRSNVDYERNKEAIGFTTMYLFIIFIHHITLVITNVYFLF